MILLPGEQEVLHDLPHQGLIGGLALLVDVLFRDHGCARGVRDHPVDDAE